MNSTTKKYCVILEIIDSVSPTFTPPPPSIQACFDNKADAEAKAIELQSQVNKNYRIYYVEERDVKNESKGGKALSKQSKPYTKTSKTHTGRDGKIRVVYIRNGKSYVKKRDAKTGKFVYRAI